MFFYFKFRLALGGGVEDEAAGQVKEGLARKAHRGFPQVSNKTKIIVT